MRCIPISSLSDPRLAAYANLRDAELLHRQDFSQPVTRIAGAFMAEGELVVRRLIRSPFRVESVLVTPGRLESVRDDLAELPEETPVYVADQGVMSEVVGFNIHRGVLAVGLRGPERSLEEVAAVSRMLVVLEDLVNHDNLGAVFRNAAALIGPGAGVLLSPRCADPLYRKSLRVSMGHVLGVPFARIPQWPGGLAALKGAGFRVIALSPGAGSTTIQELEAGLAATPGRPRLALVLGTEGAGLSGAAAEASDDRVRIPMAPGVDSLNVAVAGAIAMHRLGGTPGP
jgi:tRNA G18 (ribose-2'-O)-methylase SpoU